MTEYKLDIPADELLWGCAVVVAHPDDEVLWASSVLEDAGKIIMCYGDFPGQPLFSAGRRRAIESLGLKQLESLGLVEAAMFNQSTWPIPTEIEEGLAPVLMPFGLHSAVLKSYKANFEKLCILLKTKLVGFTDVVTHNPWGEYGHEDHVQVFRAVEAVQKQLGFRIWVTGYFSNKSAILMQRHLGRLGPPTRSLSTNKALGDRFREIYIANECWTWPDGYVWPDKEWFFPLLPDIDGVVQDGPCLVQHVNLNLIQYHWIAPGKLAHFLKSLIRHLKYRIVRTLPGVGRMIELAKR